MALQPFVWQGNQAITTPEAAARQRQIAESLIGQSATPAANWAEGLGDIAAAFTGTQLQNQAAAAEEAGRLTAAQALAGIGPNADFSTISAALANPWLSGPQATVASALLQQNLERQDPAYQLDLAYKQAQIDALNNPQAGNNETFFGTPIPFQNADGTIGFAQLGNQGTTRPIQLPEGASAAPTTRQVDTGTEIITMDIYGNELYRTPKENYQEAYDTASGSTAGEYNTNAELAAPGQVANADTALDLINQIKTSPELDWATGTSAGLGANMIPGTGRFGFQNLVDQAKSGAFLTAIQEMKGLGALSNAEGQAATQAITRINTSLSKTDFLKALSDYEAIVQRGRDRAARRVKVDEGGNETPVTANSTAPDAGWTDLGGGIRIRPIGN